MELQGKTAVITGGTGGIGMETAIGLAKLGARVVVTGRDAARGAAAVGQIQQASGNAQVALLIADLERQAEVRRLAERIAVSYPKLDILINNVGYLGARRRLTADGIETTFAVNVLTPFLLTELLREPLQAGAGARVINVTGGMKLGGSLQLNNLQAERSFLGMRTYSHAKLALMVLSYEQALRLKGSGITLNVAYPGVAYTSMSTQITSAMLPVGLRLLRPLIGLVMRNASPARAARSSIYLAAAPELAESPPPITTPTAVAPPGPRPLWTPRCATSSGRSAPSWLAWATQCYRDDRVRTLPRSR